MANVDKNIRNKNKEIVKIAAKFFGGNFANFLEYNLNSNYSKTYNIGDLMVGGILNGDKRSRTVLYIMFYDALMDYVYMNLFGVVNRIKGVIPFSGAITTGSRKYDLLYKNIFKTYGYSKDVTDGLRKAIDDKILNNVFDEIEKSGDFKEFHKKYYTTTESKDHSSEKLLNEGVLDIFRSPQRRRLRAIMHNIKVIIPKNLKARKEILNEINSGAINDFLDNISDYRKFKAQDYAEPLAEIAGEIILKNFFTQANNKFSKDDPAIKEFNEMIFEELFTSRNVEDIINKETYRFFKEAATIAYQKKQKLQKNG